MNLNPFQLDAQERLKEILNRSGISAVFEVGGGPREYGIKVSVGEYESWIYPDGADVIGPGMDKRFEIYDFDSLDELKMAYLEFVESIVGRLRE